jgi:hypothetical protein
MKRTHLLPTALFASALLAAPALAQGTPQDRATAAVDRMHKNNGTNGGPAELLRSAQAAMRRGQAAEANELLERAETRLLLRNAAGPAAGNEPTRHVAEARRALADRDRAEAMRHTNLAIAAVGGGGDGAGSDAGGLRGAEGGGGGGAGGRTVGAVDSGMGGPVAGRAVVRDAGTGGASVNREEGVLLAQSGTGAGTAAPPPPAAPRSGRGAPPPAVTLPPGDTIPGWSGSTGGQTAPRGFAPDPALGGNSRGGGLLSGAPNLNAGPGSANMTGGEPARVGGAPPGDTSRAPGSSGIGGAGVGTSGVGGPIR